MYTILKIVKVMPLLVCSVFDRIRDFVLGYFPKSIFVKKIEELGTDGLQNKVLSTIWDIDDICWWGDDETESLGDGDIKLMAVIGFAIGWLDSFVTLFFASVLGLIFSLIKMAKDKEHMIPFGPFLIMGALLVTYLSSYIDPYLKMLFAL